MTYWYLLLLMPSQSCQDITFFRIQQIRQRIDSHARRIAGHRKSVVWRIAVVAERIGELVADGAVPLRQVQRRRRTLSKRGRPDVTVADAVADVDVVVVVGKRCRVKKSRKRFCQARSLAEGWAPGVGGWPVHRAQGTSGVAAVFVPHGRHGGRVRYQVGGRRGSEGRVLDPHVVRPAVVVRVVRVRAQLAEGVRGQHVGGGMLWRGPEMKVRNSLLVCLLSSLGFFGIRY